MPQRHTPKIRLNVLCLSGESNCAVHFLRQIRERLMVHVQFRSHIMDQPGQERHLLTLCVIAGAATSHANGRTEHSIVAFASDKVSWSQMKLEPNFTSRRSIEADKDNVTRPAAYRNTYFCGLRNSRHVRILPVKGQQTNWILTELKNENKKRVWSQ